MHEYRVGFRVVVYGIGLGLGVQKKNKILGMNLFFIDAPAATESQWVREMSKVVLFASRRYCTRALDPAGHPLSSAGGATRRRGMHPIAAEQMQAAGVQWGCARGGGCAGRR